MIVLAVIAMVAVYACTPSGADKKQVAATAQEQPKATPSDTSSSVVPPPAETPAGKASADEAAPVVQAQHNYSMEEDGEYGYESALSDDEKKAGRAAKSLIMVRYLGIKDDTYAIQLRSGQSVETMSCKAPCAFIKIKDTYAGQVVRTDTVHTSGKAVMDAVFQDAQNGQLKPYRSTH